MRLVKKGVQKNGAVVDDSVIKDVIATFNPSARPPITLGHPKDSRVPAFGRVTRVYELSDGLHGDVQKTPILKSLEASGHYEGWSAGIPKGPDGRWYLHHLAWLGELPPASDISGDDVAVVELNNNTKDMLLLDMEGEEMTTDEVKRLIAENAGVEKLTEKITALEAQLTALKSAAPSGKEGDGSKEQAKTPDRIESILSVTKTADGDGSKEQAKTPDSDDGKNDGKGDDTEKQLSALFETLKNERLSGVRDKLRQKGLDDKRIESILSVTKTADAMQFSDDAYYKALCDMVEAVPDVKSQLTGSVFNLADSGAGDPGIDISKLAACL